MYKDYLLKMPFVAIVYVLSSFVSQDLALVGGKNVFPLWPPAGVALAFLLYAGLRPYAIMGVFFGALCFQLFVAENFWSASLHISIGNTLGPLVTAWAIGVFSLERPLLQSPRGVVVLFLASLLGAIITATNGVSALILHGKAPSSAFFPIWNTWLIGDMLGFLVFGVAVIWLLDRGKRWIESSKDAVGVYITSAGIALLTTVSCYIFFVLKGEDAHRGLEYIAISVLLLGVWFSREKGAILGVLIITSIAIIGTINGSGPFAAFTADKNTSLLLLQLFIGMSALLSYLLVASLYQQELATTKLQELNASLEKKVLSAIEEIRSKDSIINSQAKRQAMDSLLIDLAHHWRQPLAASSLAIQNIEDFLVGGENDDEIRRFIEMSVKELENLSKTITRFTKFYESEFDKKISFAEGMDLALELSVKLLKVSAIEVEVSIDKEFDIEAESGIWVDMFSAFFQNVREIGEARGKRGALITITAKKEPKESIITVSDNVGGIDPALLPEKLFEPYTTTMFKSRDKGLGLYSVKNTINYRLKGTIEASNLKEGAIFTIRIPNGRA